MGIVGSPSGHLVLSRLHRSSWWDLNEQGGASLPNTSVYHCGLAAPTAPKDTGMVKRKQFSRQEHLNQPEVV
jgi:hypothetical protein